MGWKVHLPQRPTGDAVERWVQIAALLKSPTSVEQATDSKPELVKILNERCFFHLEGFHKIRMLLHQRSFMTLMFCCVFLYGFRIWFLLRPGHQKCRKEPVLRAEISDHFCWRFPSTVWSWLPMVCLGTPTKLINGLTKWSEWQRSTEICWSPNCG